MARLWFLLRRKEAVGIAVYGLSTAVGALLTLLLTRILWRNLDPTAFGVWSLIDPLLIPFASLILIGADFAIVKQFRLDRLPLRYVVGHLLTTGAPAMLISLVGIALIAFYGFHISWILALLATVVGEALIRVLATALRATGDVYWFAALQIGRNLAYIALLVLAIYQLGAAPLDNDLVFATRGACMMVVSLVAFAIFRPNMRIDRTHYVAAVRYGFPLFLTTFIYFASDMADRVILARFASIELAGVYALHLKIAAFLSQAIVIPFGLWFPPERFKHAEDADGGSAFFIVVAVVLAVVSTTLAGGVWLARDILMAIIAPGTQASSLVLAGCLVSVIGLALGQALNVGLLLPGQTFKNAYCTVFSMVATTVVALVFVPFMQMAGASYGRMAGGVVFAVTTAAWSYAVLPIRFPFAALLGYFVVSALELIAIDRVSASHGLVGVAEALVGWLAVSSVSVFALVTALRADRVAVKALNG